MQSMFAKLVVGVAITVIALFGADNSIGTWKRNGEKSKSSPPEPNPITSMTMVREVYNDGVKVTNTGQRKDGTTINSSYTAKYDGKDNPVTGAPWDTISIRQIDAYTLTGVARNTGGKYRMTGRTVISKDGRTMTLTNKGTDAEGKPFTNTIVYEKQ